MSEDVKQNNIDRILMKLYGRTNKQTWGGYDFDADIEDFVSYSEYIFDKKF